MRRAAVLPLGATVVASLLSGVPAAGAAVPGCPAAADPARGHVRLGQRRPTETRTARR